jgi:hypothetical protein
MMIVTHLEKKYSVSGFFKEASSVQYKVKLVKKYDDCAGVDGNILNIKYFLLAFFPFLILAPVFMHRVRTGKDLLLLFLLWPKALYMRYWIWKSALKEEAFII